MVKNWGALWALILLSAAVCFGALRVYLSPAPRGEGATNYRAQSAKYDNQPTDYMASAFTVGKFVDDHNGTVSAFAAIFIAIFTVVLAQKTSGLHAATRGLFKETAGLRTAANEQRADMLRSIEAAERSAETAKKAAESLPRVERAYLFLESERLVSDNKVFGAMGIGSPFDINVAFKNFGKTPAIMKGAAVECRYYATVPYRLSATIGMYSNGIASGDAFEHQLRAITTAEERESAESGIGTIHLYGEIAYLDMFGDVHVTGFCWQWSFGKKQFMLSPIAELNYHT